MAQPSSREQYLLELVNRFRMAPAAELDWLVNSEDDEVNDALAYFGLKAPDGSISSVLTAQFAALAGVVSQPLAWSGQLNDSARAHNQLMVTNNSQSHFFPGELGYLARMEAAGSDRYTAVAENIYAFASSPFYAHAGLTVDWGNTSTGIQDPPGHRNSLLNNLYNEAGFSIVPATRLNSNDVGPLVVTQHLANRNTGATEWLLGVAFRDMDDDDFYSVGEGLGGVTVNIAGNGFSASVQTNEAGGYQTLVPRQGSYAVSFVQNGSTLGAYSVSVGSENKKRDLMLEVGVAPSLGFGKIVGIQFDDINGDGRQTIGEGGIAGRTVFIDANGNRQFDGGEAATTTDANGVYLFNNVLPGTYQLLSVLPTGREQTFPRSDMPLGNEKFQLDDGKNEGAKVVSASGDDVLVFNQFEVPVGQEVLTSISVLRSPKWDNYPGLSNPEKLFIYQDADGDGRPDGNEKVLEITPGIVGIDGFATVAIAPTTVSGAFFVGALYAGNGADYTFVPQDATAPAGKSWQAVSSDPNSFSARQSTQNNWLLRANSAGLQAQVVKVEAGKTVSGVNFSDRTDHTIVEVPSITSISEDTNVLGDGITTDNTLIFSGTGGTGDVVTIFINNVPVGTAIADTLGRWTFNYTAIELAYRSHVVRVNSRNATNNISENSENFNLQILPNATAGNDIISGTAGDDILFGRDGNDRIIGQDGKDHLSGDSGNDSLYGENGDDTLIGGTGNDQLYGQNGNDVLMGNAGDDILRGSIGDDTLGGGSGNDLLYGQEGDDFLNGNDGADRLYGDDGSDTLIGGNGNDFLIGNIGNDLLRGDAGNDLLIGNDGDDEFEGGDGNDRIYSGEGADNVSGSAGNDQIYGEEGDDSLDGNNGNDAVRGGNGSDTLNGNDGNDLLHGQDGDDLINGGSGNDRLYGGKGNDLLIGGTGKDLLIGGELNSISTPQIDEIIGGTGADTYVVQLMYTGFGDSDYARIRGFSKVEDIIEIGSGIYTLSNTTGSLPSGTGIYDIDNDLVAIIEGYAANTLDLNAGYFSSANRT